MRSSVLLLALVSSAWAAAPVRLATTTSVQDSGLLDAILPVFEKTSGIHVDPIAVGSGAAFKLGHDGNADLLLVHDRAGEEQFIAAGDGDERRLLMWNTFEVDGPAADPAHVEGKKTGAAALEQIGKTRAPFVSRGDDSGTHRREQALWKTAGGRPDWPGYRETGQGMGATLRVADELDAYVLTDRASRLGYKGTLRLVPVLEEAPDLRNEYSVVLLSARTHPDLNHDGARRLADWLVSEEAAKVIAGVRVGGEPLFHVVHAP